MSEHDAIAISRDALQHAFELLECLDDEGPRGEGWQSDRLVKTLNALRAALAEKERAR